MNLFLKRAWIQITADRKRFVALVTTVSVGLLLWARVIVVSNMPRTAIADEEEAAASATSEPSSVPTPDNRRRDVVTIQERRSTGRDPFEINTTFFPRLNPVTTLDEDPGKSGAQPTEDPQVAEARLLTRLQEAVDGLRLEATIAGGPLAVISGRTYQVGDIVTATTSDGGSEVRFRLQKIQERSVTIEWENRSFELKMRSPGVG